MVFSIFCLGVRGDYEEREKRVKRGERCYVLGVKEMWFLGLVNWS